MVRFLTGKQQPEKSVTDEEKVVLPTHFIPDEVGAKWDVSVHGNDSMGPYRIREWHTVEEILDIFGGERHVIKTSKFTQTSAGGQSGRISPAFFNYYVQRADGLYKWNKNDEIWEANFINTSPQENLTWQDENYTYRWVETEDFSAGHGNVYENCWKLVMTSLTDESLTKEFTYAPSIKLFVHQITLKNEASQFIMNLNEFSSPK